MMEFGEFRERLIASVPVGIMLDSPRGRETKIVGYSSDKVAYIRGQLHIPSHQ